MMKKNLLKKATSLALSAALILGIGAAGISAKTEPSVIGNVKVTIAVEGTVELAQQDVEVYDYNDDGKMDLDEALKCAHEQYYMDGAEGYQTADSLYGMSLIKLWGNDSGNFGYYINNQMSFGGLSDEVKEGDLIDAFVTVNAYPNADAYAYFTESSAAGKEGEAFDLTLKAQTGYDEFWNPTFDNYAGADITVYDDEMTELDSADYSVEDNGDGTYTVTVNTYGDFFVVASTENNAIVPAVCAADVAQNLGNVKVTVAVEGTVELAQQDVEVYDYNDDGKMDLDEALKCAHEQYYKDGADGYLAADGLYGMSLVKLWGNDSGNFGYYINNQMSMLGLIDEVKEGDLIDAYVTVYAYPNADAYAYFTESSAAGKEGEAFDLTLKAQTGYDEFWNPTFDNYAKADIAVYDAEMNKMDAADYSVKNNGDGTYTVTVDAYGDFYAIASEKDNAIVPAVCFVTLARDYSKVKLPFSDVKAGDWFYDEVQYVYANGIMKGTGDGSTFEPKTVMNRAMFVTMLYRVDGEEEVSGRTSFTDVKAGSWYEDAVIWANTNGIVKGSSPTTFSPDANISREQMAVMMYRYADYLGLDVSAKADLSKYSDASSVSSWAKDAMSWANASGLITGVAKDQLAPANDASRAEAATVFMRFMETVM